jgi:hypothetical protein
MVVEQDMARILHEDCAIEVYNVGDGVLGHADPDQSPYVRVEMGSCT